MARTTLNNYLLPHQANLIARTYHHPAWVAVAETSHIETQDHSDRYNCLTSVKYAKQFALLFANVSIFISQNNKAKIDLDAVMYMGQCPICRLGHETFWDMSKCP
ncbi:6202_t:CDS:1, partial [Funneliformis geosporum]